MHSLTRRNVLRGAFAAGVGLAAGSAASWLSVRQKISRVLIIGGGPSGAATALALRKARSDAHIVLIEKDPTRIIPTVEAPSRFMRPNAAAGLKRLRHASVEIALDDIVEIDWQAQSAKGFSGRKFAFDRIVMAPGVGVKDEGIAGYDAVTRHEWPAAWGSPREAKRLQAQLAAMPEAGHVVMRIPEGPVSHPAGLYQHADEIAAFLARAKPGARLTVLDANPESEARRAFLRRRGAEGGRNHVEWRSATDGGRILAVDSRHGILETSQGRIKADVVNFITAQCAGDIAHMSGLTDASGWCPCAPDQSSRLFANALVVGDAVKIADRSINGAMKSGVKAASAIAQA